MPNAKPSLLIVDDESSVRTSLSCVLAAIGYRVRTAEDGLSALIALREEIPEVLISDLNMPGMSGFELLTQVQRRFPNLKTIAMSGAFSGDEATSGVAADAFYQKGSSMACMLRIIENLPWRERMPFHPATPPAHASNGPDGLNRGEADLDMAICPDCRKPVSQGLNQAALQKGEAFCDYCGGLMQAGRSRHADLQALQSAQQSNAYSSPGV